VADASGNTYAFWNETISGVGTPMTARHVASASGWEPALPVGGLSSLSNPEIANAAIDGSGVITLLVLESGNANLYASRYDPVAGIWGTAQEIDAPLTIQPIAQTALVADAAGNVTASWIQDYGSSADISFASFRAGFGWGAPEILDVNVALLPIALAADRQGGATAAWTHGYQFVGLQYISASRWLPSTTSWTTATQISPNHTLSLVPPVVAVDGAGIATVLWQEPGGVSGVRSDAYGAAWSAPAAITGVSAGAVELALTADVAGNLMLTYLQNPTTVSAVRYSATSVAWEAPLAIGTLALGNTVLANGAVPVMDASGTVTLVWLASVDAGSPSSVVAANRFH
jgi:hypothetical protein